MSEYDLSSLKYILCGAAPLSAELQAVLEDRFEGKITVVQGYGSSLPFSRWNLADRE